MKMAQEFDVIVIGGGPAGISGAIRKTRFSPNESGLIGARFSDASLVTAAWLITTPEARNSVRRSPLTGFCGQDRDQRRTAKSRCVSLGCYICVDEFE